MMKLKELLHKLSEHCKLLTLQASERLGDERKTDCCKPGSKQLSVDPCSLLKILH